MVDAAFDVEYECARGRQAEVDFIPQSKDTSTTTSAKDDLRLNVFFTVQLTRAAPSLLFSVSFGFYHLKQNVRRTFWTEVVLQVVKDEYRPSRRALAAHLRVIVKKQQHV
ncbi:hypothetical protein EYF80_044140 [Liparis tanakae]|uniref:Uncharacterized protein n=1 Tax=Liparis tanakae TaxID=230148 RepID=A0A4Z2FZ74_9TELE|nr:hypothetical protein EYF80_044140 [Liparis tanakae]